MTRSLSFLDSLPLRDRTWRKVESWGQVDSGLFDRTDRPDGNPPAPEAIDSVLRLPSLD